MSENFSFPALGTVWNITTDGTPLSETTKERVRALLLDFERRFSRFLPESEVNAFRHIAPGSYIVSSELAMLLARAMRLRTLTKGAFDPAVAPLLEKAGYGRADVVAPIAADLHSWSIAGELLTISGPVAFDLGGIGKGYAIDRVFELLREEGHEFILVEGGGDMVGTIKSDGSPWRVAVEWPGRPESAVSVIDLAHAGFAASDVFRRRFRDTHHILDATTGSPVRRVVGAAATARSAWDADTMTSLLFMTPAEEYHKLATLYAAQYLVVDAVEKVYVSRNWGGEVYV
jgi:thiamine biosynthesis lipoprotein